MEIVSDDLQLGLIHYDGLLGHFAHNDRFSQLDELDRHVYVDYLAVVDRNFIIIVFRLIEKKLRIVRNESRIVAVYICKCDLIPVVNNRNASYRFRCGKVPDHSLNSYFMLRFCLENRYCHQDEDQKHLDILHLT